MPELKRLIGVSMWASSIPPNFAIAGIVAWISRRDRPITVPKSTTFSRPVSSAWKPAPTSSSGSTRPVTSSRPAVGAQMPAMSCRSVDLPDPFVPMIPTDSPR